MSMQYLAQNRTSNVRHLASKLHGEAIAETDDSRLFLVLGLWEVKLMHNFLSILYFFVFKIFLWFLQQFAQKVRERDGTLLSTYNVVGAGVGTHRHWSHLILPTALPVILIRMRALSGGEARQRQMDLEDCV